MKHNLKAYHEDNRYTDIFNREGLLGKMQHVENVIDTARAIARVQHLSVNFELLAVMAEHHDDGRVNQFNLLGKFWDTEVSHNVLGADRLEKFIVANGLEVDDEVELLREVMLYHGRQHLAYNLCSAARVYIDIVTAADDFENATSCVSYLIREVETDAKGYNANKGYDQRRLSPEHEAFILKCFEKGEKFDKVRICKTYADYVVFAATLATSCIKKYGNIAKTALMQTGYGYKTILDGFHDVFTKTLEPDLANRVLETMKGMLQDH